MIRLYILSALFFSSVLTAQEKSYFRFTPAIDSDTLEIANAGLLQYDINITYHNNAVTGIDISGKIGLVNKYAIENPGTSFTLYSGNEKKLELDLKASKKLGKARTGKPNFIDYEISDFRYKGANLPFCVENILKIVEKLPLHPLTFPMKEKILIFKNESGDSRIKRLDKTALQFFLYPGDIRYVNVFDADELILKIPYKELLSLSNK
jgi:hypothetical protein